jgi:thiol-disulfide isomerase/thioredoxin
MSRPALAVLALILAVGGLYGYRKLQQRWRMSLADFAPGEPVAGTPAAPVIEAERPDGSRVRLPADPGRVVLVHFWATWCTPCRAELPGILALGEELARTGKGRLYAVSVDASWKDIREHFGGQVPDSVVRAGRESTRPYGAGSIPVTFLIDRQGRLVERYRGAFDWDSDAARAYLAGR